MVFYGFYVPVYFIDLCISIGIILLFLLFRKIFAKYLFNFLLKLSKKAPTHLFSQVFTSFEKPIQWLFIIIGVYFATRYFPLFDHNNLLFLRLIRSAIIVIISWGLYNLSASSSAIFEKLNDKYSLEIDAILIPFLSKVLRVIIIAVTISVIAEEFDYNVSSFIAGLGIGGLAISLAAKDALANLFGGFVIITERPFSIGDWVRTSSVEGTVEEISFRSTRFRTSADAVVTIPNATLANDSITNMSKMKKRQITFQLKLPYDTAKSTLETIVTQIRDLLMNHPEVHQDVINVTFDEYQENGYGISINFFTKTTIGAEFIKVKEDINFKIKGILEKEGISPAVPGRRLYVDSEADLLVKKRHSQVEGNEG